MIRTFNFFFSKGTLGLYEEGQINVTHHRPG